MGLLVVVCFAATKCSCTMAVPAEVHREVATLLRSNCENGAYKQVMQPHELRMVYSSIIDLFSDKIPLRNHLKSVLHEFELETSKKAEPAVVGKKGVRQQMELVRDYNRSLKKAYAKHSNIVCGMYKVMADVYNAYNGQIES